MRVWDVRLGERLGVTQQAVAQAERWDANPTVALLQRAAEACGARVEIAFVGLEDDVASRLRDEAPPDPDGGAPPDPDDAPEPR